jgi:protein-S-isoprenylcysteine O-methyltransferase Ste14
LKAALPSRGVATLLFFAFTSALGIVAHLVSELAGLGWHDDADLIASPRHGYLAAIAVALFAVLFALFASSPKRSRAARIASLVEALPFRGRGAAFLVATFLAQFGFFAVTQLGEGCPLCSGDMFTGVLAAAFAAILGAIVISFGKRRLLAFAFALFELIDAASSSDDAAHVRIWEGASRLQRGRRRTPFAFRYRPPPR